MLLAAGHSRRRSAGVGRPRLQPHRPGRAREPAVCDAWKRRHGRRRAMGGRTPYAAIQVGLAATLNQAADEITMALTAPKL